MISSERRERVKFFYFCVGKMFYIPTRLSRKSYKWLRFASKPILCVCLKHAILLNIVLVNHIVCRCNVLMFVTLVIWSCSWRLYRPETFQKLEKNPYGCERAERESRKFCTFASETLCFFIPTRKPETREKAIHDCEQAIFFVCVWNMRFFSIFCWWIIIVCRYNVSLCS